MQVRTLIEPRPMQVRTLIEPRPMQVRTLIEPRPMQVRTLIEPRPMQVRTLIEPRPMQVRTLIEPRPMQVRTLIEPRPMQVRTLIEPRPMQVRTLIEPRPMQVRTLIEPRPMQVRTLIEPRPMQVRTLIEPRPMQVRTLIEPRPMQVRTLIEPRPMQVRTLIEPRPMQVRTLIEPRPMQVFFDDFFKDFLIPESVFTVDKSRVGPARESVFTVDKSRSGKGRVVVKAVQLGAGDAPLRCEISGEAPYFQTDEQWAKMEVAVVPSDPPTLTGVAGLYPLNSPALITCSSPPALPKPELEFRVNNEKVDPSLLHEPLVQLNNVTKLYSVSQTLRLRTTLSVARKGYVTVRCSASVRDLYWKNSEVKLNVDVPEQFRQKPEFHLFGGTAMSTSSPVLLIFLVTSSFLQHF
ncbi:uncharacterized protein LOC125179332 [Hyalella azteca]|uniref:Uncharacterized protein LOC125179332 n=1 Tax=Hyalella azteca TaxID=294128 RepID=A0A979FUR4_HYAAZ|nr:uncharacterized protein LOC125179332 [Hyalella azteca]